MSGSADVFLPGRVTSVSFVVRGMHLKSDSVANDCLWQFDALKKALPETEVTLYSEIFDDQYYPDAHCQPIEKLFSRTMCAEDVIVYHFCDGWDQFWEWLQLIPSKIVCRWHNNTPPWFFINDVEWAKSTLRGLNEVIKIGHDRPDTVFWNNSRYTCEQLQALVGFEIRSRVVSPRSALSTMPVIARKVRHPGNCINLVFVSRVVPHKGHLHVLRIAGLLQEKYNIKVSVTFPGRHEGSSSHWYVEQIRAVAEKLSVALDLPGEVTNIELDEIYGRSDFLVCMSEHEGFGLPLLEALQRGIPIVAWSNTAVSEITEGHPLCSPALNLEFFARVLREYILGEDLRLQVANFQSGLLRRFSNDTVVDEMQRSFLEDFDRSYVGSAFKARDFFDSPSNLVSRYDIEVTQRLLDVISPQGDRALATALAKFDGIWFRGSRFSSHKGEAEGDNIKVVFDESSDTIVFGPYASLIKGKYVLKLHLQLIAEAACSLRFQVGVWLEPSLADFVQLVEPNIAKTISVFFEVGHATQNLEFKIFGTGSGKGSVLLEGANLMLDRRP